MGPATLLTRNYAALVVLALVVATGGCDTSVPEETGSRPADGVRGEYLYADWGAGDAFAVRFVPRDSSRASEAGLHLLSGGVRKLVALDLVIGAPITFPQWSPDSDWIAFVAGGELYKVRPDGTALTQLTREGEAKLEFAWSPDGRHLVYKVIYGWGDDRGLWVVAADGSGGRRLRRPPPDEMCAGCPPASSSSPYGPGHRWLVHGPDWSPDGREVVYVGTEQDVGDVRLLAYDTTAARTRLLMREPAGLAGPRWSPDGDTVAVTTLGRDGRPTRLGLVASGGAPRWLAEHAEHPNWSPDGQSLVYRRNEPFSTAPGNGDLWLVNVQSGVSRQLTASTGRAP